MNSSRVIIRLLSRGTTRGSGNGANTGFCGGRFSSDNGFDLSMVTTVFCVGRVRLNMSL